MRYENQPLQCLLALAYYLMKPNTISEFPLILCKLNSSHNDLTH